MYNQIDPNRLGEMQRAMRIAQEYGYRLNQSSQSLRNGALDNLIAGYPSHSFVIDRKEAATLFSSVRPPTNSEKDFCSLIWKFLGTQNNYGPEFVYDESDTIEGEQHERTIQGDGEQQPEAAQPSDEPDAQDSAEADGPSEQAREDGPAEADSTA